MYTYIIWHLLGRIDKDMGVFLSSAMRAGVIAEFEKLVKYFKVIIKHPLYNL